MKTFSRIIVTLPLWAGIASFPAISPASETRIAAAGGIATILPDETSDLNLFLDGNPAGLVYLNSRSRADLSAQWSDSDQEGPWGSVRNHHWGLLSNPDDREVRYEGLMVFPSPHWAFQAAGSISGAGGTAAPAETEYGGFVRACYAFPFGAVGVELLESQTDSNLSSDPSVPASEFLSGDSSQNQLLVKTGAAFVFPSTAPPGDPRWQAGAYLALPAGPQSTRQSLSLSENNSAPILLNQATTTDLYHSTGVELIYEVPASLKVEFSASLLDESSDLGQTASAPTTLFVDESPGRLHFQSGNLQGALRYSIPLNGDQNLKCGGSLGFHWEDTLKGTRYSTTSFRPQQIDLLLGLGFEEVKEYTVGLQWKSRHMLAADWYSLLSNQPAPAVNNLYQLAFGGEKWLSPVWALRLGLVVEQDDSFQGNLHTLTTTLHAGAGWEDVFGRMDLGLNLGQTLDTGNSSNTIGLFGAELSSTIFL